MGSINFMWWNLENFFDTDNDPISRDFEYTPEFGWTLPVFNAKKANLAAAIKATHGGQGPELLAVAEIEKDGLLQQLIDEAGLTHMRVVLDASGTSDLRGIDVAMAYDERKLTLQRCTSHVVHLRYRTRDIFEVVFTVNDTNEELVIIASHWPSRRRGKFESEPFRIAVAENISFLLDDHVKVTPKRYEELRAQNALDEVLAKWETKVMLVGDFNDEPHDRSLIANLTASHEQERVTGKTNDISKFEKETADYREQQMFLYNAVWKLLTLTNTGSFFIDRLPDGEAFANRYQMLDQIVVSRGMLAQTGLRLNLDSVNLFMDSLVATASHRPRPFDRKTLKGTSDHLPLIATLEY